MFTIGIDPHKGSHTAAAIDDREEVIRELRVAAGGDQHLEFLRFVVDLEPRVWAIEAATGLGSLLAQQLVESGETVLDVPPALSARVRLLDSGSSDKTDPHDARAAAIVALRHDRLRQVGLVDHSAVLRLLADRHRDLASRRTQTVCRLHALLCLLIPGGMPGRLSARRAGRVLRTVRPHEPVATERKRIAIELLGDVRRIDNQLTSIIERINEAVVASGTTLTEVYGVGALVAAIILGHTGDIARFPTAGHYARYNATAPIAASSGPRQRHRLNPRGNRQLNRAMHIIALTQISHDTPGHDYYDKKLAEGKTRKEALRALKRRVSDVVYRQLIRERTSR